MIHEVKTEPEFFRLRLDGKKPWEIRAKDRPYSVGDYLAQNEYSREEGYTGRYVVDEITNVFEDERYCKEGYVILSLRPCKIETENRERCTKQHWGSGCAVGVGGAV